MQPRITGLGEMEGIAKNDIYIYIYAEDFLVPEPFLIE